MSTDPEAVHRDIDRTREALGSTIDELVDRVVETAHPKNVAKRAAASLQEKVQTPTGMAAAGGVAGLIVAMIALRVRNGRR
ncbi:MAG: DUF3618 domain-containing protein [Mycobacteriales bacterium]